MSTDLIAFLDTLGRQPTPADFESGVAALDVDADTRSALLGRDPQARVRAFGSGAAMWCIIAAPEDEPKPTVDAPGDAPAREPDDAPGSDPDR